MSMTERSAAAIDEKIRSDLDSHFQKLFARFSRESLAWLALPPAWTGPLAEACHFPTEDLGLLQFLDRASDAGFCTRRASSPTASGESFWVPAGVRERILQRLKTDTAFGAVKLQEAANRIGREMLKTREQVKVPPVIARWAELAAHSDKADETVNFLNDRVSHLVEADDTGAASAWVDTGAALAASLGGALNSSVQLGTRRLELAYRQAQNERHLESFQERPEQTATFLKLIEPDNPAWELHYLGMGGVGKTMLLRYIAGRLAKERGIPTSRIDFDHLSPDYPVRRPGQLLVELAVDLRSYATTAEVEQRFTRLRTRNDRLLEALSGEPPPEQPLANIRRPEFQQLLSAFTDLLVALPRPARAPIVLILDTCEELSRLPSRAGIQPAVEATFEILDRVHSRVPDVRVILAGRRLLGSSGPGWRADETRRSKTGLPLPARECMGLHEIRGFDRREAIRFLTEKKQLSVSDEVLQAVVDKSHEAATVAPVIVEGARRDDDPRFNPFDLALYANWIREDSEAVIDQILSGKSDPYVEMRIVHRLRNTPIEPLLPCLVLWERFDKAMVGCGVPDLGDDGIEDVFARLADLEWIDVQHDEDLGTEYLEIDHNLYPRLLAYFREPPRDRTVDAAAARLAAPLARLVHERVQQHGSVRGLSFEHVNAALAASAPAAGAALWNDLMLRIAESADWSWAQNVTSRLLGEDRAVDRRPEVRAAVLATLTAAEMHLGSVMNLAASWEEVAKTAPRYPDLIVSKWLMDRACAGRVASMLQTGTSLPEELRNRFWALVETFDPAEHETAARRWAEQLAASLCAALGEILDRSDPATNASPLTPDRQAIERLATRLNDAGYPVALAAFVRTLAADARRLGGDSPDVALGLDDGYSNDSQVQQWMDWRVPEPLGDHLRLRLWKLAPRPSANRLQLNGLSASLVEQSLRTIASIESERFLSLLVQFHLAHGPVVRFTIPRGPRPVTEPTLADIVDADEKTYSPARQASTPLHDTVPPLFVSLAMAYLAVGDVERAISLVDSRLKTAEASRRDPATVRHAEIARLRIARRMRIPQPGIIDRIQQSTDPELVRETLAAAALAGPDLVAASAPAGVGRGDYALAHAWWSAQTALAKPSIRRLEEATQSVFSQVPLDPVDEADLPAAVVGAFEHDRYEASLLFKARRSDPGPSHGSERNLLRRIFLTSEPVVLRPVDGAVPHPRQSAEIAFEEGELLALRLPDRGAVLLRRAADLYAQANDALGVWTSSIAAAIAYWHAGNVAELHNTLETITKPAHARLVAREPGLPSLPLSPWEAWDKDNTPGAGAEARRGAVLANLQASGGDVLRELLGEEHVGGPVAWTGWRMRLALGRRLAQFDSTRAAEATLKPLAARLSGGLPAELQAFPELAVEATPEELNKIAPQAGKAARRDFFGVLLGFGVLGLLATWAYFAFSGRLTPGPTSVFSQPTSPVAWAALLISMAMIARAGWSLAQNAHGALLGVPLMVLGPAFFALYWGVGWISQVILPWNVSPLLHLVIFVALVAGMPLARPLTRRLRQWLTSVLAARGRLRIWSWAPDSADTGKVVVSMSGVRTLIQDSFMAVTTLDLSTNVEYPRPGAHSYVESSSKLPKEMAGNLREYRVALGRRKLVVDLDMPGDLAAAPWEAVLSLSSIDGRIENDPLQFRRVLKLGDIGSRPRQPSPRRLVEFLGDPSWVSMWAKGWSNSGAEVMRPVDATPIFLHILGEPVTTSRGVSMSIGGNVYTSDPSRNVSQEMGPNVSLLNLVSALDGVFEEAAAVLVQMEPADSVSRLDTDRQQAGYVRTFAASLVSRGVERVITMPPLPAGLAESVLEVITPALVNPEQTSLTEAVARARGRILGWPALAGGDAPTERIEALKELAYDVCLFVRTAESAKRSQGDN